MIELAARIFTISNDELLVWEEDLNHLMEVLQGRYGAGTKFTLLGSARVQVSIQSSLPDEDIVEGIRAILNQKRRHVNRWERISLGDD